MNSDILVISGGQSGADLGGNLFALNMGISTAINTCRDFSPIFKSATFDKVKVNVVTERSGVAGLVERRMWNVINSDLTLIVSDKIVLDTRGSIATMNDCLRFGKTFCVCPMNDEWALFEIVSFLHKLERPRVVNVAGSRALRESEVAMFMEDLWIWD